MHELETFIRNFQRQNHTPGISNVYVVETYNKNGERTNRCYGMNLMTDLGFIKRYSEGVDFPSNLYVGNGTDETFSKTSNVMMSVLFDGLAATVDDKTRNHAIPLFYAKGEATGDGIITAMCRFLKASYDYTISGVSEDTLITEYGIGTAYDQLWTHSFVYDIKGQKTTITKKKEEKLVIHVFLCCSYYENLITDNYANGLYPMITTNQYMFRRFVPSNVYTYKRNNIKQSRTIQQTTFSKVENSTITNTTTVSNFTMTSGSGNDSGYFDGWAICDDGFTLIEPQTLDEPEAFVLENFKSNDPMNVYGFAQKFGLSTGVPITQMDVDSVKAFDAKSKSWNVPVSYYNDPTRVYDESTMQTTFAMPIYYANKINYNGDPDTWYDAVVGMYLYQNLYPDNGIKEIDSAVATLYATDKYWDVSSWTEVTNFKNIPESLRNCRYWITNTNTSSLIPTRERPPFHLTTTNESGETITGFNKYPGFSSQVTNYYRNFNQCDNYEYGWFAKGGRAFVPSTQTSFVITTTKVTDLYTYGKWLAVITANSSVCRLFDMSNVKTSSTEPTAVELTPPFTSSTNLYSYCYRTESTTGILCLQSTSQNECCILDLRGETVTAKKLSSRMACAIYGKEQIAYIPVGSNELRIYDVTTSSDVKTLTLPSATAPKFMCGHTDYVWFTDGSSYSYVANISGTDITYESVSGYLMTSNLPFVKMTCVDDVFIIYNVLSNDVSTAIYITLDNVTTPKNIPKSFVDSDTSLVSNDWTNFYLRYVEGNALALIILATRGSTGCRNSVIDFGQYLANGSVNTSQVYGNDMGSYSLYGKYIMHNLCTQTLMLGYMPIRIEGTTTTVGTQNCIKRIEDKSFAVSYTNEPVFLGVPPGTQA